MITLNLIQENVEKLLHEHEQLLKISQQKTELIKNSEMEALVKVLLEEKKVMQIIMQLEDEREKLVNLLFRTLHIDESKEKTVTNLLPYIEDGVEKEQLVQLITPLIETITALKANEDLNSQLLEQSMQFIQLSLSMMDPTTQKVSYGEKSQQAQRVDRSVFDSKA